MASAAGSELAAFGSPEVLETVALTKDGGITKYIIKKGDGEKPKAGNKVTCHYVGKFPDGRDFDSSRKRGKPFEFVVGVGQVIKGWDVGMLTMAIGEKAILKCTSDYAYGDEGAGGVIPGGATLLFEVEMLGHGESAGGCKVQ